MSGLAQRVTGLAKQTVAVVKPSLKDVSSGFVRAYDQILADNAQYVVKDAEAASKLGKQYFYTSMARIPTGFVQIKQEAKAVKEFFKTGREMNAKECGQWLWFGFECYCWFVTGEVIGRGSLIGYNV